MRVRKLLLIHPTRSTRGLIKKYIFSELGDIEVSEAESGSEAASAFKAERFDIIIAADELKDMSIAQFKQELVAAMPNNALPLIIISESESLHVRNVLVEQGFDRVVQIRLRPSDLIHKINAVCDPRTWRKDARYHLANVKATIEANDRHAEATLINISKGGILVELTCEHPSLLMSEQIRIGLSIGINDGRSRIDGLTARLSRIEVLGWEAAGKPNHMRTTFIFTDLPDGPKAKLDELLKMAREEKLKTAAANH
jgi:DNA-binding response OmpR family regulator